MPEKKQKEQKVRVTLISEDKIDGAINAITRDAGKLQNKIHSTAVSILKVWESTYEKGKSQHEAAKLAAERLTRLQEASPYHRNAFSKWVGEVTPLKWADETKTWYAHKDESEFKGGDFMAARDLPFWKVSPAPQAKPFDMWDELQRLVEKAAKRAEEPKTEKDVVDREAIRQMQSMLQAHRTAEEESTKG